MLKRVVRRQKWQYKSEKSATSWSKNPRMGGKNARVTRETPCIRVLEVLYWRQKGLRFTFFFFLSLSRFQSVYNLLGETLSRLQQYAEAERWFQASLASQPDHVPAHITYGKLLARNVSSRRV